MDGGLIFICIIFVAFMCIMWYMAYRLQVSYDEIFNDVYKLINYPDEITKYNVYEVADQVINHFKSYKLNKFQKDTVEYYFNNKDYSIIIKSLNKLKDMKSSSTKTHTEWKNNV